MSLFLVAILFEKFEKNANKKTLPSAGKVFSVVCLLLLLLGIPAD